MRLLKFKADISGRIEALLNVVKVVVVIMSQTAAGLPHLDLLTG